jgi:carboxyl-terminal processing protease
MYKITFALFFIFYIVSTAYSQIPIEVQQEITAETQKFKDILETAYLNYVDSVKIKNISEGAFSFLLKELDPHSLYFDNEQYKIVTENNEGKVAGVGLFVISLNDTITVISVSEGTPADSASILPGDKILFIDGVNACKMLTNDAFGKINGKIGTSVNIITKSGRTTSLNEYNLIRQDFPVPSLNTWFIISGSNIGYIKSNRFSKISDIEMKNALNELKIKGMKELIIDLRGNLGGFIEEACHIVNEFIPEGKRITYTKARNSEFNMEFKSDGKGNFQNLPVIVLIDENTASSAEILSGALQDLDRGLIIGQSSFGKGSVQKSWQFKDGSAFNLTIAKYYTPSGRLIQKPYLKDNEKPTLDESSRLKLDTKTQNQIESMIQKAGNIGKLPVYKTEKGRTVVGGGGIIPDIFIKSDTVSLLSNYLKNLGIFIEFAYNYLGTHSAELRSQYGNDFLVYNEKFKVTENMLDDFIQLSKNKKIWNEQMFLADKEYIINFIKAAIAHAIWGDKGFYAIMLNNDIVVKKAIGMIPEAEKMINQN